MLIVTCCSIRKKNSDRRYILQYSHASPLYVIVMYMQYMYSFDSVVLLSVYGIPSTIVYMSYC